MDDIKAKVDVKYVNKDSLSVKEDLALARSVLEELLGSIDTAAKLSHCAPQITGLLERIDSLLSTAYHIGEKRKTETHQD